MRKLAMSAIAASALCAHIAGYTAEENSERIAHVERIELPPAPERVTWADRPNESRCGWPCISRIPTTGE